VSAPAAPAPLRGIRAAFAFLTRIPVGGFPYAPEDWAWSSAHFPLVGLSVGVLVAALRWGLRQGLADGLALGLLLVGASMVITGAFHEDGLADTADGLAGSFDREKLFAIMKDSRVGSFGAAALVVSIGARAALYADLGAACAWALPLVGCASRVGPVWMLLGLPYATPAQAKSTAVARTGLAQAIVATLWFVLAAGIAVVELGVSPARLGAMVAALALVAGSSAAVYRARAGGVTGDLLGATEQLGEVAALVVLAWRPW
jgi:adenosylcobinamide-GDP ribazoletransferase